jgi:hypothetical protein
MHPMLAQVTRLFTFAVIVLAWFCWSYRTIRALWRRGETKWGRLVYNYGVRVYGVGMAMVFTTYAAHLGWSVVATSDEYRLACAIVGAALGAILGIPIGLGMGYIWGKQMAAIQGLKPDSKPTHAKE